MDCGCEHSGILYENKDLYLFGLDAQGQLGSKNLSSIDHYALGGYFTVVVKKNKVKAFGAIDKEFTVAEPVVSVHAQLKHFLVKCDGVIYYV